MQIFSMQCSFTLGIVEVGLHKITLMNV